MARTCRTSDEAGALVPSSMLPRVDAAVEAPGRSVVVVVGSVVVGMVVVAATEVGSAPAADSVCVGGGRVERVALVATALVPTNLFVAAAVVTGDTVLGVGVVGFVGTAVVTVVIVLQTSVHWLSWQQPSLPTEYDAAARWQPGLGLLHLGLGQPLATVAFSHFGVVVVGVGIVAGGVLCNAHVNMTRWICITALPPSSFSSSKSPSLKVASADTRLFLAADLIRFELR